MHRLPNPAQPDHLASIEFTELTEIDPHVETLAAAAANRRTDRRPFLTDPVPQEVLAPLREVARLADCMLSFALEDRERRDWRSSTPARSSGTNPSTGRSSPPGRGGTRPLRGCRCAAFQRSTCAACLNGTSRWSPRGS
ncbi:hypothetical protein [Saccharopolyspora pogona]|uniref:hypothetical protein n=1 Tax=Saccharopolyspora pogona TaxID=333966 RepID=UPI0016899496|nr:hypothetical protein [Saccharopolyspora pogona]